MKTDRKIFWQGAAIAGAVLGLARVILEAMKYVMSNMGTSLSTLFYVLSVGITVWLVIKFTQKYGKTFSRAEGFSYGQSFVFILVMFMFAGILEGIWSAVYMIHLNPEVVTERLDAVMKVYQDILPSEQFNTMYDTLPRMMRNPAIIIFSSVIASAFTGAFWGVIISFFTRRKPDIFAESGEKE